MAPKRKLNDSTNITRKKKFSDQHGDVAYFSDSPKSESDISNTCEIPSFKEGTPSRSLKVYDEDNHKALHDDALSDDTLKTQHSKINNNNNLISAIKARSINVTSLMRLVVDDCLKAKEDGTDDVVIGDFLMGSNYGMDLLSFLEYLNNGKTSESQSCVLFQLLELVLLYLHSHDQKAKALSIVKRILTLGPDLIRNTVSHAVKSLHVKSVFKLLIAMVMISPVDVFSFLSVTNSWILKHLNMRDARDPQDARTCIIHFILSFLVVGDISVIRQLCEKRDLLTCTFFGLKDDKAPVIELFLKTIKEKVIQNTAVSKTAKIHIFHVKHLKNVIDLFEWSGPKMFSKKGKYSIKSNKTGGNLLSSDEDIEKVRSASIEFLTELLTSHKHGIIFKKVSSKSSANSENPNYFVTELLKSIKNPFENNFKSMFIASVLSSCPEQITYFFSHVKHSFEPRNSPIWFSAMDFLMAIASSFNLQSLSSNVSGFDKYFSKTLLFHLGVSVFSKEQLENGLENACVEVKLKTLEYILLVLSKTNEIFLFLSSEKCEIANPKNLKEVLEISLQNILPSTRNIFSIVSELKEDHTKDELNDYVSRLSKSINALALICDLYPTGAEIDMIPEASLVSVLRHQDETFPQELICDVRVCVIKLLLKHMEKDASSLLKSSKENNVLYLLLGYCVNMIDPRFQDHLLHVLSYYIGPNETLLDSLKEIKVWVRAFGHLKSSVAEVAFDFFWKTIMLLLNDPSSFIDKCVELQAHFVDFHSNSRTVSTSTGIQDMAHNSRWDIEDRLLFSPLVPAALETLKETKTKKIAVCASFLEEVLSDILHCSSRPEPLCSLVMEYDKYLSESFINYLSLWLPRSEHFKKQQNNYSLPKIASSAKETLKSAFYVLRCNRKDFSYFANEASLNHFKGKKAPLLAMQSLLYLKTELDDVLLGKDIVGVEWLIRVLDQVIDVFMENMSEGPKLTDLHEFLNRVIGHPALLKWFLIVDTSDQLTRTKEIKHCEFLVTAILTKYLTKSVEKLQPKIIIFYKQKLLSFSKWISSMPEKVIDETVEKLYNLYVTLANAYTANEIVSLLNIFAHSDIVLNSCGVKLISTLLKNYINHKDQLKESLEVKTVKNLFDISRKIDVDGAIKLNLDKMLLQLLQSEPRFSFFIKTKSALKRLKRPEPFGIEIVLFLARQCPRHHSAISLWLEDNSGTLVEWPDALVTRLSVLLYQRHCDTESHQLGILSTIALPFWRTVTAVAGHQKVQMEELEHHLDIRAVLLALLLNGFISKKEVQGGIERIFEESKRNLPSFVNFKITIQILECVRKSKLPFGLNIDEMLATVVLRWIILLLKEHTVKNQNHVGFFKESIICFEGLDDTAVQLSVSKDTFWTNLLHLSLNEFGKGIGISSLEMVISNLKFFLCVIKKVYIFNEHEQRVALINPGSKDCFNLFITNQSLLSILREENKDNQNMDEILNAKAAILDILVFLVVNDPSIYDECHIRLFLEWYRATFRETDQKVLHLLRLYEARLCVTLTSFSPHWWGKSISDQMPHSKGTPRKIIEPKLDDLLNNLRRDIVMNTALNFPIDLELSPIIFKVDDGETREWRMTTYENPELKNMTRRIYDPRFLMPLLTSLLKPGLVVNCYRFIQSNCLVFCFAALSSLSEDMRAAAYWVLFRFYHHLDSAYAFKDRKVYHALIELLANAVNHKNLKLSCVTATYLVKACTILGKPNDPLYQMTYNCLFQESKLDLESVPNFVRMFFSKDLQHLQYRMWIVNLINDGFKTNLDFHLCQKCFAINAILLFANSSLTAISDKLAVVKLLKTFTGNRAAALSLYRDHGFLSWIISSLEKEHDETLAIAFVEVMEQLWLTSLETSKLNALKMEILEASSTKVQAGTHPFNKNFPVEFIVTHLYVLRNVKNSFDLNSLVTLQETLDCAVTFLMQSEPEKLSPLLKGHLTDILEIASSLEEKICKDVSNEKATKCLTATLRIISLVTPNLTADSNLAGRIIAKMINCEGLNLPSLMRFLRNVFKHNPQEIGAILTNNIACLNWQDCICNRLVKCISLHYDKKPFYGSGLEKAEILELVHDMVFVGQLLPASKTSNSLNSLIEEIVPSLGHENIDLNTLYNAIELVLKLWSNDEET